MSDRLRQAFEQAAMLPEDEQDSFAAFLLAELEDEQGWQRRFEATQDALGVLAREARQEHAASKTEPLDDLLR